MKIEKFLLPLKVFVVGVLLLSASTVSGQISDEMKTVIKEHEGLNTMVYMDGLYRAVGYGHRLKDTDVSWIAELELYDEISRETAELLFDMDVVCLIGPGLIVVRQDIGWQYPQNVYDVMGSLIYNMGLEGLRTTAFYRAFTEKDYLTAFRLLPDTKSSQEGLFDRRMAELEILMRNFDFGSGGYPHSSASCPETDRRPPQPQPR